MIGLALVATGKYDVFLQPLIDSVNEYFLFNHSLTVFIFSDKRIDIQSTARVNIEWIKIDHKPFPYATLLRYKHFDENKEVFKDCSYIFYSDVDMLFIDKVGEEILNIGLTCTQHPGFYKGGWGSQNVDIKSNAYLHESLWNNYCAGGFQGGSRDEYLMVCAMLNERIQDDEDRGVMAEWHDESHWNWYLKTQSVNKLMLNPSYCFPEAKWAKDLPFHKRLLALDKNHKEIRA